MSKESGGIRTNAADEDVGSIVPFAEDVTLEVAAKSECVYVNNAAEMVSLLSMVD